MNYTFRLVVDLRLPLACLGHDRGIDQCVIIAIWRISTAEVSDQLPIIMTQLILPCLRIEGIVWSCSDKCDCYPNGKFEMQRPQCEKKQIKLEGIQGSRMRRKELSPGPSCRIEPKSALGGRKKCEKTKKVNPSHHAVILSRDKYNQNNVAKMQNTPCCKEGPRSSGVVKGKPRPDKQHGQEKIRTINLTAGNSFH